MINISYDKLFSIELLHKYAADNTCNDFLIVPSAATKQLLANNQVIAKQNGNVLQAWTKLDAAGLALNPQVKKPFIIPAEGLQLTFFMILNNPLFFNYTGITAANNNGNIYYFSNRNINNANNKNLLTGGLKNYTIGNYSTEDLVINSGSVYQSLKNNNADSLNNMNSWRQVMYPDPNNSALNIPDPNRFMSSADLVKWMPPLSPLASNTATQIVVNDYAGNLIYTKTIQPSYPLDLSDLNAGKYLLTIGANPQIPIYINNELSQAQVFGVIDIFIESTLPGMYKILDSINNNTLLQPAYSIYFLNRATIWKYVLKSTNNSATVTDSTNIFQFAQPFPKTSPTTILSQFSIPLNEAPIATLSLDGKSPPCATADRLSKNMQDLTDTHYYSEIYLNY